MEEILYSENPVEDIWNRILKLSYSSNIERMAGIRDKELQNAISGALVQSYEYFSVSRKVSLNVSPLLMYYGCVNLMYGAALISTGNSVKIENHGAKFTLPDEGDPLGNGVLHLSLSQKGAFQVFKESFGVSNTMPNIMLLKDVFAYISDISMDYNDCYTDDKSSSIPVEIVIRKNDRLERILLSDEHDGGDFDASMIVDYDKAYLAPQITSKYIVLRTKYPAREIGLLSISGQKNLVTYRESEGKLFYLNELMAFFLGLYSLSMMSRYHPASWYPFVQKDNTGERGLFEVFISRAYRKIPNLVLNIMLKKEIKFQSGKLGYTDVSKDNDTEEIRSIVNEEITKRKIGM